MSILNLIRPELLNSPGYAPGGESAKYRLHANELPWAPIEDEIDFNFYPDYNLELQVQNQLAGRYKVEPDQIVLTRGSDDGIDLVTRLFLNGPQDAFMQFPPTFPMYAFYVRLQQAQLIQCPLQPDNDFHVSRESIENNWQPHCKIIMFCSPNNPTGNLIDLSLIAATCERYANQSVVIVDEAYIEFANQQSATTLIPRYENLVVLRTLSKAHGLAGLRVGSIMAQSPVIQAFKKIIAPYILSSAVMNLATKALAKNEWFSSVIKTIQESRTTLMAEFKKIKIIEKVYSSETNFILIKTSYAEELNTCFMTHHIAVRNFPTASLLHDHLRITVGNEKQNKLLLEVLSTFNKNCLGLNDAKDLIY